MSPLASTLPTAVRSEAVGAPRVDWSRIAVWTGALSLCLAFWATVVTTTATLL